MIDKVIHENILLGIIIKASHNKEGIEFFTTDDSSQQLGYMNRSEGYVIPPHRHNLISREVLITQEVLFIKSGKIRLDFYNDNQDYLLSKVLEKGDVVLLSAGGHGFEMIESSEIIEVKQGPYLGEKDKVRFKPIDVSQIKY